MEIYIPTISDYLKTVEIMTEPIFLQYACNSLTEENNRIFYRTLLMISSDVPRGNIRDVGGSSLEAWRRLHHSYDPMTPQRNVDEIRDLMYVSRAKSVATTMAEIQTWENKINRVSLRKGCTINEVMTEDMRHSILMSILSVNMEKEIMEHVDRYPSYAALRQRIEHDAFMHTTGPAPMINHTEAVETPIVEIGDDDPLTEALNAFQKAMTGIGKGERERDTPGKANGKGERQWWRCGKKGHTQPEL